MAEGGALPSPSPARQRSGMMHLGALFQGGATGRPLPRTGSRQLHVFFVPGPLADMELVLGSTLATILLWQQGASSCVPRRK